MSKKFQTITRWLHLHYFCSYTDSVLIQFCILRSDIKEYWNLIAKVLGNCWLCIPKEKADWSVSHSHSHDKPWRMQQLCLQNCVSTKEFLSFSSVIKRIMSLASGCKAENGSILRKYQLGVITQKDRDADGSQSSSNKYLRTIVSFDARSLVVANIFKNADRKNWKMFN